MFSMVSSYLSIAGQAFKCGQTLFFRMKSNPKSYVNVIRTINSCAVQARGMVFLKCVCGDGGAHPDLYKKGNSKEFILQKLRQ